MENGGGGRGGHIVRGCGRGGMYRGGGRGGCGGVGFSDCVTYLGQCEVSRTLLQLTFVASCLDCLVINI